MPADAPKEGSATRLRTKRPVLARSPLRRRVWTLGRLLVLSGALLGTYFIFFLAAAGVASRAREVKVPDIRGKPIAEATAELARVGLAVRLEPQRRADPKIPADHVLAQEPEPGSVLRRQRAVRIRLSDGQSAPALPAIAGQTERAAEITLAQAGIEVGLRSEVRTSAYPTGSVIAQDPAAEAKSATVALLVNRGEAGVRFVMPDLIGTFGARSAAVLRARGFRVALTAEVPYPGLPSGIVVRQTPQAGFQIALEEPISIEVSR
ncbi:MAG TPA: PASTA domain-containing protein [Vicinamibacterales bacterium]|nr:PASTA domain-containing protein [Vicinamibacterales bacterium]